jgi:hypothetical protein
VSQVSGAEILGKDPQHFYLVEGDGARAEFTLRFFDMGASDVGGD